MQTSGLYKVDAILGPQQGIWAAGSNTIYYTTSVVPNVTSTSVLGVAGLSASQASDIGALLSYVGGITGVNFVFSASDPGVRVIHFGTGDLPTGTTAICEYNGGASYDIIMDTTTYPYQADFGMGGRGWEVLLHEVGHALGLEHPSGALPSAENSRAYTLMSIYGQGYRTTYSPYDLLALSWIYGGDGVGGTWGIGSTNGPVLPPEAYPPITHDITGGAVVSEADGQFSFTVTRTGNISVATTVAWAITGAVDAADFGGTLPSGTVSFASGESTKTVSFAASNDELPEPNEAFTVTLGARTGNGAILGTSTTAAFTLADDDTPPTISITPVVEVREGAAGGATDLVFTVGRSGNLGKPSDVTWAFANSSTSADDFAGGAFPGGGTLSFAAGAASAEIVVRIAGDNRVELDEGFFVNIYATRNGSIGTGQGVGTILNDDADNTFTVAAKTAAVLEGNSGTQPVEFTVTRSGNTAAAASVSWTREGSVYTDDLAAGALTGGTLNFAAGETSKTLRFDVKGDTRVEGDETLVVKLTGTSGLGAGLGTTTSAATTITTDDPKGLVSVATTRTSVAEGAVGSQLTHSFTLTRTGDLTDAATIPWHVAGDVDASDFAYGTLLSGTAAFAAGAATTSVTFTTTGDALFEADERLTLALGDGDIVTASPTQGSATVTLTNDDEPNEYRIAVVGAAAISEGSSTGKTSVRLEVTRAGDRTTSGSVDYQVAGAGANAVSAADFGTAFPKGTVTFNPGEASKTLFIYWLQDKTPEADEGFSVTLQNANGAGISATRGSALVTITNDDPLPTLAISASTSQITEGAAGTTTAVTFDITRTGDTSATSAVTWTLAGTGTDPADRADAADFVVGQAMSGSVNFAAGQTRQTITVQVKGDASVEHTEAFAVTLSAPVAGAISATQGSASVSIVNDDASHRTITGTAATNEKLTLHGPRADYTVTYDATDDHVKVIDSVAGRDGEIDLTGVEVLQFTTGRMKDIPDANQKAILELGQAALGSSGMTTGLWGTCVDIVAQGGAQALGVAAVQLIYGSFSARDMAVAVLHNLAASSATLGGADPAASYAATVDMLTGMFTGDATVRGQALATVATVLGTLEADPVYGRVAASFNDRIGAEWIAEFAEHSVTLTGLPEPLVEVAAGSV